MWYISISLQTTKPSLLIRQHHQPKNYPSIQCPTSCSRLKEQVNVAHLIHRSINYMPARRHDYKKMVEHYLIYRYYKIFSVELAGNGLAYLVRCMKDDVETRHTWTKSTRHCSNVQEIQAIDLKSQ